MYKSAGQKINTPKNKVPTSIKREPRWIKITKGTNTIYVYYNESIPSLIGSFLTNCGIYNNPKILTQDQFISSKHNNEDIIPSPNDLIEQFKTKLNNDLEDLKAQKIEKEAKEEAKPEAKEAEAKEESAKKVSFSNKKSIDDLKEQIKKLEDFTSLYI